MVQKTSIRRKSESLHIPVSPKSWNLDRSPLKTPAVTIRWAIEQGVRSPVHFARGSCKWQSYLALSGDRTSWRGHKYLVLMTPPVSWSAYPWHADYLLRSDTYWRRALCWGLEERSIFNDVSICLTWNHAIIQVKAPRNLLGNPVTAT